MIDISEDIHKLIVCQWAYGWSQDELILEINKMIDKKQWEHYFKRKEEEERIVNDLIFEINSRQGFDISYLLKEDKTKSYGNKYIKRKHRF